MMEFHWVRTNFKYNLSVCSFNVNLLSVLVFFLILDSTFSNRFVKSTPPKPPLKPKQFCQSSIILINNNYSKITTNNYENLPILAPELILRQKSQQNRNKQIQNCRKAMITATDSNPSNNLISLCIPLKSSRSMDSIVAPTLISVEDGVKESEMDIWSCSNSSCSPPFFKLSSKTTTILPPNWTLRRKTMVSGTSFRQSKVGVHPKPKRSIFYNLSSVVAPTTAITINNNGGGLFSRRVASSWKRKKAKNSRKSSRQNLQQNFFVKNGFASNEDDALRGKINTKKFGKFSFLVIFFDFVVKILNFVFIYKFILIIFFV